MKRQDQLPWPTRTRFTALGDGWSWPVTAWLLVGALLVLINIIVLLYDGTLTPVG